MVKKRLAPQKLDRVDRELVSLLQADPRAASKELAESIGVSEVTIANRIRGLSERKLMIVTGQEDIRALGYDLLVLLDICVKGRPAEDVGHDLAKLERVGAVSITMTSPEIIVNILAQDRADLDRVIETEIAAVRGVWSIEGHVVTKVIKFQAEYGELEGV